MMKLQSIVLFLFLAALPLAALAEQKETRAQHPHELSIGIGGGLVFDWGDPPYDPRFEGIGTSVPDIHEQLSATYSAMLSEHYLPHFYLDYQYRLKSWLSVGMQVDFFGAWYDMERRNYYGDVFYQYHTSDLVISFVPQLRFTFFHADWVNLYAGGGVGYAVMLDMKDDMLDDVDHTNVFQVTPLGISIGKDHWFATAEIGLSIRPIAYQFFDRLGAVSVGYRF